MMNIIYDNKGYYIQKNGGVSVVNYELQKRVLERNNTNCTFINYGASSNPYFNSLMENSSSVINRSANFFLLKRYLPVKIESSDSFIFHSTYFSYTTNPSAINITTIHDFTDSKIKQDFAKKLNTAWHKHVIRQSDFLVCISESTKKDLEKYVPEIDASKIRVIYNGVSENYRFIDNASDLNITPFLTKSYVLFVGSRVSYKNFDLLTNVIAETDFNLVITGKKLSVEEEIELQKKIPKNRYYCAGFVSEKDLCILYNNAAALVYPSSCEGFGLPVIEAQKSGCPVIAQNATSIPEIIGDTPLLMQECSEIELLNKLRLLSNQSIVSEVIERGLINSKRFSWDKMADDYMSLYEYAITNK